MNKKHVEYIKFFLLVFVAVPTAFYTIFMLASASVSESTVSNYLQQVIAYVSLIIGTILIYYIFERRILAKTSKVNTASKLLLALVVSHVSGGVIFRNCVVSVDEMEAITGIDFFPGRGEPWQLEERKNVV